MPRPLDTFPLARTADPDQLRSVLSTLFQDSVFAIRSDRNAMATSINFCPLRQTGLMYGNFGSAIRASFGEMRFYVQGVTLRGTGEQFTDGEAFSANVGGLLSPQANLGLNFSAGFETLALTIEADALAAKLGALIGSPPSTPIQFEVDPNFDHPAILRLRRLIAILADNVSTGHQVPLVALIEMEQELMACFLAGNRHNHSDVLHGHAHAAAPWQVKRAEEYIETCWDQPLTIEILADVTHTSARSLFHAFKRSRGYSPMMFLRQVRLQRAWLMLNAQEPDISVTGVAFACGFGNLGHFAKYFRAKFGESPSSVLARSKGLRIAA